MSTQIILCQALTKRREHSTIAYKRERERENLFAKSNNKTNNSKQHKIQWQAAREA